jgi:hypothetical protein
MTGGIEGSGADFSAAFTENDPKKINISEK